MRPIPSRELTLQFSRHTENHNARRVAQTSFLDVWVYERSWMQDAGDIPLVNPDAQSRVWVTRHPSDFAVQSLRNRVSLCPPR